MSAESWQDDPPSPLSVDGPRTLEKRDELPEVLELVRQGWAIAPEAPVWAWLPAVFPRTHRTWVHDRSTWYWSEWVDGEPQPPRVLSEDDLEDARRLYAHHAELCGFPGWDPTRVWLLRGGNGLDVDQIVDRIVGAARRKHGGVEARPELASLAADVVARALHGGA